MKMNRKMRILCDTLGNHHGRDLAKELRLVIERGFIRHERCVFLKDLYDKKGNASLKKFPDETGYECFVNHVHLDDYAAGNPLIAAFSAVEALGDRWRQSGLQGTLRVIVTLDEDSCVLRCHLMRSGQQWLADVDSYEQEAVLIEDVHNPGQKRLAPSNMKA